MGKSAPKAPDPAQTAAAQGAWNSFTAQQQQQMNMIGQNSPWGSLDYQQTGSTWVTDPNGKRVEVPTYTANTTLSPEQQKIFDASQSAQGNLANIANDQSAWLVDYLKSPFEFNNQSAENWAYDLAQGRIAPQQEQNRKDLENRLINSGIRPGTAAYNTEMARLTNANTDQNNQLALQGRSQAFQEQLAQRNQPLNEIIGLMSGSQVQSPNATFAQTPQSQVAGVDYSGLVNQKYQADMSRYNSQMGALGGLFGAGLSMFSDRRLKENIERIGKTDSGVPVYKFNYIGRKTTEIGYMAQDLLELQPETVFKDPDGYYRVRYDMVK
jgi:hypothetical protein